MRDSKNSVIMSVSMTLRVDRWMMHLHLVLPQIWLFIGKTFLLDA